MGFRDAEQSSFPKALCLYLLFPPLSSEKKNNLDSERTLKIQPSGQTPAGHTCQSKLPQRNYWRLIFCVQMASVIERSPSYLWLVLKITIVFRCSIYWSLSRCETEKKARTKEKKSFKCSFFKLFFTEPMSVGYVAVKTVNILRCTMFLFERVTMTDKNNNKQNQ